MTNHDDTQTLVFRKPSQEGAVEGPFPDDLRHWQSAVVLARRVRQALNQPPDAAITKPAVALPAVLLWCLATGRYGSLDIAALCEEEPMCRHLSGGLPFTWSDVQRWRRDRRADIATALARLLELCRPETGTGVRPDFVAEAERRLELAVQTDRQEMEAGD